MMKNILVATDFSQDADRALEAAIELAQQAEGRVTLLHVQPMGSYMLPPPLDVVTIPADDTQLAAADQALAARAARVRDARVPVEQRALLGASHEGIIEAAKSMGADLIVIGSHGAGALATALIGSVASRVIRHAPCPVLVIPHGT